MRRGNCHVFSTDKQESSKETSSWRSRLMGHCFAIAASRDLAATQRGPRRTRVLDCDNDLFTVRVILEFRQSYIGIATVFGVT